MRNRPVISQDNPNKRRISSLFPDDEETDAVISGCENQSALQESVR
jgi:hypothetical protein